MKKEPQYIAIQNQTSIYDVGVNSLRYANTSPNNSTADFALN